jgi:type IV secretory pathway VirD2 relaxase
MIYREEERETTDMTQLLEVINAKGDEGELEHLACNDELFWKGVRALAEDSAKADEEGREYRNGSHTRQTNR